MSNASVPGAPVSNATAGFMPACLNAPGATGGANMPAETPAVIVGAGVNGLGVARSLARAKVPAWLLDTDMRRPEMHTRTARPLPVRALHGDALVEELVHLGVSRFRSEER